MYARREALRSCDRLTFFSFLMVIDRCLLCIPKRPSSQSAKCCVQGWLLHSMATPHDRALFLPTSAWQHSLLTCQTSRQYIKPILHHNAFVVGAALAALPALPAVAQWWTKHVTALSAALFPSSSQPAAVTQAQGQALAAQSSVRRQARPSPERPSDTDIRRQGGQENSVRLSTAPRARSALPTAATTRPAYPESGRQLRGRRPWRWS